MLTGQIAKGTTRTNVRRIEAIFKDADNFGAAIILQQLANSTPGRRGLERCYLAGGVGHNAFGADGKLPMGFIDREAMNVVAKVIVIFVNLIGRGLDRQLHLMTPLSWQIARLQM